MSPADLALVLERHGKWLRGEEGGQCADLAGANLAYAVLVDANLEGANLAYANLRGAYLGDANLVDANLRGAVLVDANLEGANLRGAVLVDANLEGANLAGADLTGANLWRQTMPDGRRWEDYCADHLAGICSEPEVIARALVAWGEHQWRSCPMHSALGIDGLDDIEDEERRRLVGCWVALYDGGHLTLAGAVVLLERS